MINLLPCAEGETAHFLRTGVLKRNAKPRLLVLREPIREKGGRDPVAFAYSSASRCKQSGAELRAETPEFPLLPTHSAYTLQRCKDLKTLSYRTARDKKNSCTFVFLLSLTWILVWVLFIYLYILFFLWSLGTVGMPLLTELSLRLTFLG